MLWIVGYIIASCVLHLVVSDGYSKETPAHPFNSGSTSSHGGSQTHGGYYGALSTDYESRYHGPLAMLIVLPDGTIAETHEVAAARAAHLAALNKAKALWYGKKDGGSYHGALSTDFESRYNGPAAMLMVLPDGTIAETPEVAAARAAHLSALNKAKALWYGKKDDGSYKPSTHEGSARYSGWMQGYDYTPMQGSHGSATVLPSGFLSDTPAVTSARAAHLHALLKAQSDTAAWKPKDWSSY